MTKNKIVISEMADDRINIDDAVQKITSDPDSLGKIVASVRDNPKLFAELMAKVENDPSLKNKVMSAAGDSKKLKGDVSRMSKKEKEEMTSNYLIARKSMRDAWIDGVQITMNGRIKKYRLKGDFPKDTIFESGDMYSIQDNIVVFTTTVNRLKNKVASTITGLDIFGELVLVRSDEKDNLTHITVSDIEKMKMEATCKK